MPKGGIYNSIWNYDEIFHDCKCGFTKQQNKLRKIVKNEILTTSSGLLNKVKQTDNVTENDSKLQVRVTCHKEMYQTIIDFAQTRKSINKLENAVAYK